MTPKDTDLKCLFYYDNKLAYVSFNLPVYIGYNHVPSDAIGRHSAIGPECWEGMQ